MKRRRLVALVSACVLVSIGLLVIAGGYVLTRTRFGEEKLRELIQQQVAGSIHGKLYLGRISGGFLGGVTIDTVAIRDEDDSLFFSSGKITASYDSRDLIDRRLFIRSLTVDHPRVVMRQYENGDWNHKRIFRSTGPKLPKAPGRSFGDYVVFDGVRIKNGSFTLTLPWHPDDSLKGAKLDSAIRFNLTRGDKEIESYVDKKIVRYVHQYHWRQANGYLPHVRLADPDSNKFGRWFVIDQLNVAEHDPPFAFSNLKGTLRHLGDSIWVNIAHFDLPASTGSGGGKIVWGSDLPVRYDIAIKGDSVALNDVAWVYPTLPRTGGGSTLLSIKNDPRDLKVIDYKLTQMDMRSTASHLRGNMTFSVGGPVLVVKDVDMDAQPFDFALLRQLNGKPFPVDWRGQLYGTVRARGGPLTHFVVDDSRITFRDAHVPGATSRFSGNGELNILFPAFTEFRGFDVDVASLDLRTIQYLYPNFPRLGGTIAGVATLDSSWLDVRFSNANVVHQDGPGEPSRVTGSGRVTWGEQFMTYDVDLQAQPLSLTMLARSYPAVPMKGLLTGPIKAKGTVADLAVNAALTGDAGTVTFDGRMDIYPPGFIASGSGEMKALNLAALIDKPNISTTSLNGQYHADIRGDSLANLRGGVTLGLGRSQLAGVRLFPSRGVLRFADGRVFVDSLDVETTAGALSARGALGLAAGIEDSLRFQFAIDSLGGLRPYVARATVAGVPDDSLGGSVLLSGIARGNIKTLTVRGSITGSDLYRAGDRSKAASGRFAIENLLGAPSGSASFRLEKVMFAGVELDTISADVNLASSERGRFRATAHSRNGVQLLTAGSIQRVLQARITTLELDTLTVGTRATQWALAAPAHVRNDTSGIQVDSVVLRNGSGGRLALKGTVPLTAEASLVVLADSVPLADVATIAQLPNVPKGYAFLSSEITGTREHPEIRISSRMADVRMGQLSVEQMTWGGQYSDRRFDGTVSVYRHGLPMLRASASLPADVRLFSARPLLDEPMTVTVQADSADLGLIEMVLPTMQQGTGRLTMNLAIGGTLRHKKLGGRLAIANGQLALQNLGIVMKGINGQVMIPAGSDSADIRLRGWSGAGPANYLNVMGWVRFRDLDNPSFNVQVDARGFHVVQKRTLANLDISTSGLVLSGEAEASTLTGSVTIDRGFIYLPDPEILRKQVVDINSESFGDAVDTVQVPRSLFDAPSSLVKNMRLSGVQIRLGDDVRLQSREADIKLSGTLNVRTAYDEFASRSQYRLALEGTLSADRGRYTLDLGPVKREFAVQRGEITFQGTPDLNPILDITALYNVKRPQQQDLGVLVRLHGPLNPRPVIDFSSTESYEISQSDLVSYLVTGQPAFQLTGQNKVSVATAAAVLLPSASTVLASKLRDQVGSWVDVIQVQGGAYDDLSKTDGQSNTSAAFRNVFLTTRVGGEKQVGNNLFVSVSAGLCSFGNQQSETQNNFLQTLGTTVGYKVEYRFDPRLSLQLLNEPSSMGRNCGQESVRGIVPTPRQWGLSLFRSWHF